MAGDFGILSWLSYEYWATSGRGSNFAAKYWFPASISFILYLPTVFGLQRYMRDRPPMKLKWSAFTWNMVLSLLSLLGCLLVLSESPEIMLKLFEHEPNYSPYVRCVTSVFALTKAFEFGDTIFLVLRKRPVIFLHWYHHLTVAIYSWHAIYVNNPFGHSCAFINLAIHAVMYCYYAAGCILPRHPLLRSLRPFITGTQTVQMFIGMYLSWRGVQAEWVSTGQYINAWASLLMYTSYAYLFGEFYMNNYVKKKSTSVSAGDHQKPLKAA